MRDKWVILTANGCPWCDRAKKALQEYGVTDYVEFNIDDHPVLRDFIKKTLQVPTVPQVFCNGYRVGGFSDLEYFLERCQGERDEL